MGVFSAVYSFVIVFIKVCGFGSIIDRLWYEDRDVCEGSYWCGLRAFVCYSRF